jgi:hypothetical protein
VEVETVQNSIQYFKVNKNGKPRERISDQIVTAGFSGDIKVYDLGLDDEASMSLIIEGTYEGEECCVAVGYGENRQNLAIRKKWYRHAP